MAIKKFFNAEIANNKALEHKKKNRHTSILFEFLIFY